MKVDVQEVMKKFDVKTDASGKWISSSELENLIVSLVNKCAEISDKTIYCPGQAIKKEFKIE